MVRRPTDIGVAGLTLWGHQPVLCPPYLQRSAIGGFDGGGFLISSIMLLSSHMPELASFEVLLAIAKTGSLGAAAREVGLTQQAASARRESMEPQTGVQLAVRTPRGSHLPPAGVVVVEWAARLLDVAHHVDAGLGS